MPNGKRTAAAVVLVLLAMPVLFLYAAVDSGFAARRAGEVAPGGVRRPAVFALFLAVGLFYPAAALTVVRANVWQAFKVPAASMTPTIVPGDMVLVNKLEYRRRATRRGVVVVFRCPGDRERNYVKRLVGLPGDRVEMVDGELRVNGERVELERLPCEEPPAGTEVLDGRPHRILPDDADLPETKVPADCYFVLGDHRANSRDSRAFGPVPRGDLLGPVE